MYNTEKIFHHTLINNTNINVLRFTEIVPI